MAHHGAADRLFALFMERKGGGPRLRLPSDQRIYAIQDNLSAHTTPGVLRWASANKVSLVPTAMKASWTNPMALVRFVSSTVRKDGVPNAKHHN